jgi:hypothetical protein
MRKTHKNAVLKNLLPDQQQQLYDYLAKPHTYEEAEAWLATQGIETNAEALSKFWHWWPLVSHLRLASSMGDALKDILRELPGLDLDEERIGRAAQTIFEAQALKEEDSKLFVALRQLRQNDRNLTLQEQSGKTKAKQKERSLAQKDQELKLAREKFELEASALLLDAATRARADEINASTSLTRAQKIAAMRKAAFTEIDELQASGRVVIPK